MDPSTPLRIQFAFLYKDESAITHTLFDHYNAETVRRTTGEFMGGQCWDAAQLKIIITVNQVRPNT